MQANICENIAETKAGIKAKNIIKSCVHCGFCLATCPTYQLLGDERDSPRGRIYLIKSILEGEDFSKSSIKHLDRCLTCRSCETTCPSDVEYSELMSIGLKFAEKKRPLWQKAYRYIVRKFLTTPFLFNPIGILYKHSKIKNAAVKPQKTISKVLLLGGCVQPILAPNINHNIKNILAKLNYEVLETSQKECCGGLDKHLGAKDDALLKIKRNIDKWFELLNDNVETIISSASGCGLTIKDYGSMFDKSSDYYKKATVIADKTQDIAQFLIDKDLTEFSCEKINIAYHEPCTMQHGQKLSGITQSILKNLGYKLTPIKDQHLCCGSAGSYSIFQPKISKKLKKDKLKNLKSSKPQLIVTSNIGCLIHLQKGNKTPVKHWIELLN